MRAYIGVIIVFVCVLLLWHGNQVVASRDYDDVRSERVYAYVCEHINILKRNGGFVPSYMGRTNIQDMVCFPAEKDDVDEDIMANIRATLTSTLEAKRSFALHYETSREQAARAHLLQQCLSAAHTLPDPERIKVNQQTCFVRHGSIRAQPGHMCFQFHNPISAWHVMNRLLDCPLSPTQQ